MKLGLKLEFWGLSYYVELILTGKKVCNTLGLLTITFETFFLDVPIEGKKLSASTFDTF